MESDSYIPNDVGSRGQPDVQAGQADIREKIRKAHGDGECSAI